MQIDDAEDAFVIALDFRPVLQSPKIVAQVKLTARLNARENTCLHDGRRNSYRKG
jgi:hypothetical protein